MTRDQIGDFLYSVSGEMDSLRFDGVIPKPWDVWVDDAGQAVAVVDPDDRELMMLYVLTKARGKCAGKRLITDLLAEYKYLKGQSTRASMPFYAALGFKVFPDGSFGGTL